MKYFLHSPSQTCNWEIIQHFSSISWTKIILHYHVDQTDSLLCHQCLKYDSLFSQTFSLGNKYSNPSCDLSVTLHNSTHCFYSHENLMPTNWMTHILLSNYWSLNLSCRYINLSTYLLYRSISLSHSSI